MVGTENGKPDDSLVAEANFLASRAHTCAVEASRSQHMVMWLCLDWLKPWPERCPGIEMERERGSGFQTLR